MITFQLCRKDQEPRCQPLDLKEILEQYKDGDTIMVELTEMINLKEAKVIQEKRKDGFMLADVHQFVHEHLGKD